MRRLVAAIVAIGVSGCAEEIEQPEIKDLVLNCTNSLDEGTAEEGQFRTIRLRTGFPPQSALEYFNYEERRWFEPCRERGDRCSLTVNERFIHEISDGPHAKLETLINRTTGTIKQTLHFKGMTDLDVRSLLDGTCHKAIEPVESETRF